MRTSSRLVPSRVQTLGAFSASLAAFLFIATSTLPSSGSGASTAAFDRAFERQDTKALDSPRPFQVFPRNNEGKADIPVRAHQNGATVNEAHISKPADSKPADPKPADPKPADSSKDFAEFVGDRFLDVPNGGPYTITTKITEGDTKPNGEANNVFVGDLWILAGGSNMVGHGKLADAAPKNPKVSILTLDNEWRNAEEPLLGPHVELAPDPIDIGAALDTKKNPRNKVVIAKVLDKPKALTVFDVDPDGMPLLRVRPPLLSLLNPVPASLTNLLEKQWTSSNPIETAVERGINNLLNAALPVNNPPPPPATGLGLTFASAIVEKTSVPIGLIAYAYDDAMLNDLNNNSTERFVDLVRRLKTNGGQQPPAKVKGVIWFQGEADAESPSVSTPPPTLKASTQQHEDDLNNWIRALRKELKLPRLPFLVVQLGRRAGKPANDHWNAVREAQRRISNELADVYVVASIDLGIEGKSYINASGLKRLGARLAKVAAREVYNVAGATRPNFESCKVIDDTTILVRLQGVNPAPQTATADPQKPADKPTPPEKAHDANETKINLTVTTPAPATTTPATTTPTKKADEPAKKTDEPAKKTAATEVASTLVPGKAVHGFSIRDVQDTDLDLIATATVEKSGDSILLKLSDRLDSNKTYYLWYGHGRNPTCGLVDSQDMAVPTFGPIGFEFKP